MENFCILILDEIKKVEALISRLDVLIDKRTLSSDNAKNNFVDPQHQAIINEVRGEEHYESTAAGNNKEPVKNFADALIIYRIPGKNHYVLSVVAFYEHDSMVQRFGCMGYTELVYKNNSHAIQMYDLIMRIPSSIIRVCCGVYFELTITHTEFLEYILALIEELNHRR